MSDILILHLHPILQKLYARLISDLTAKNITARMIQGWRDPAYQDKLKAQGISPLSGGQSKHCFTLNGSPASKAFDLGIFNSDGSYVTNGKDVRYDMAGDLWNSYKADYPNTGLLWGGDFINARKDPDHFEIA